MKERPILFSGPMVRAILEGRKTQTRRVIKPQPFDFYDRDGIVMDRYKGEIHCPYGTLGDRLWVRETFQLPICFEEMSPSEVGKKCVDSGYRSPWAPIKYGADGDDKFLEMIHDFGGAWGKNRVSIHMPRWASRITLEITGVKVERLNEISEQDAIAEGIIPIGKSWFNYYENADEPFCGEDAPIVSYQSLWESINGRGSWASNPWVWVIEFNKFAGSPS